MAIKKDHEAELVYGLALALVGENYDQDQKNRLWASCKSDTELRRLSLLYLVGNSDRAELNLSRLKFAIEQKYATPKK